MRLRDGVRADASLRIRRACSLDAAERAAEGASGRVLLSLREHLQNRHTSAAGRIFANRYGRAWTALDSRSPLEEKVLSRALAILDEEITRRLPDPGELIVDPDVLDVALPLSGKAVAPGLGMLPRGSLARVEGELLRFFVHWRQAERRTEYDLSTLMLDASYDNPTHISWTNLTSGFAEYSGDLTEAPHGPTGLSSSRAFLAAARHRRDEGWAMRLPVGSAGRWVESIRRIDSTGP